MAKCANCGRGIGRVEDLGNLPSACILEVMLAVVLDEGAYDPRHIRRVWTTVDADRFWEQLQPVFDWLDAQLDSEEI